MLLSVKLNVTVSYIPREASSCLTMTILFCNGVKTGFGNSAVFIEVAGMLSSPIIRTTSSIKSCSHSISPRHDGEIALILPFSSLISNPRLWRISSQVSLATSIPIKVFIRSGRRYTGLATDFSSPAISISEASPPQISKIIFVA